MSYTQGSSADLEELDSLPLDSIQAELNNWQRILFHGDMDGSQKPADKHSDQVAQPGASGSSLSNENHTSAHTHQLSNAYNPGPPGPPHVPPETYNYLIHALLSLQNSASRSYPQNQNTYPHAVPAGQLPPSLPQGWELPWSGIQPPTEPIASAGSLNMFAQLSTPGAIPQNAAGTSYAPLPVTVPANSPHELNPEQTDEAISITEEKRRRNTAASARFRIKKKQKSLNLERTVADLTGRAEDLEREAADLRRENGWLKEIVLLKGRNFGAFGQGSSQSPESSSQLQSSQGGKDDDDNESESNSRTKRSNKGKGKED